VSQISFSQFSGPKAWYYLFKNPMNFKTKLAALYAYLQALRETRISSPATYMISGVFTVSTVCLVKFVAVNRDNVKDVIFRCFVPVVYVQQCLVEMQEDGQYTTKSLLDKIRNNRRHVSELFLWGHLQV
jgi:hypothetical protein